MRNQLEFVQTGLVLTCFLAPICLVSGELHQSFEFNDGTNFIFDAQIWCQNEAQAYQKKRMDPSFLAEKVMKLHEQKSNLEEAIRIYSYLLCEHKEHKTIYLNLADLLTMQQRYDDAVALYKRMNRVFPDDNEVAMGYHRVKNLAKQSEIGHSTSEIPGNVQDPNSDVGEKWPDHGVWWKYMKAYFRPKDDIRRQQFTETSVEQLLKDYEERHREAIASLKRNSESPSLKFVVVGPGSGFGNRQMVIVSAFLYAVLSKRVLLVDWVSHKSQAFGDVHELYESSEGLELSYSQARHIWPEWPGWGNLSMIVFDNTHYYTSEWGADELACRNFEREHQNDAVVAILTDQYVASFIMTNPHYLDIVNRLGNGGNLYGRLFSYLLRPVSHVRRIVNTFVKQNFEGFYVIGIQVRFGVGQFYLKEDEDEFWHCAEAMARQLPLSKQKKLRYFIASDSQEIIQTAKRKLAGHVLSYETIRGNDFAGKEAWYGAAVDNFLLSECDDLIISSTSTFGYVAAARRGIPPMTMSGMFRRCVRPLSSQPQNTAHAAIKRTSCHIRMRPEEDMLCANLGSNHACNSPSAFKMASRLQNRPLVKEFNFNMHREGCPAMPSDVVDLLDEIGMQGGIKKWENQKNTLADHLDRGRKYLESKNVSMARKEFGYAAAIAFIDGNSNKRVDAYTKLALSYISMDFDVEIDLSGAMHMFWRILNERGNATMMLNQAQLLGQYSGVPKVVVGRECFSAGRTTSADGAQQY